MKLPIKHKFKKLNNILIKISVFLINFKNFLVKKFKISLISLLITLISIIAFVFIINLYYINKLSPSIKNFYEIDNLEHRNVALILGAGINSDKSPSLMLKDRLEVGFTLYKKGIVSKLLVSGDNRLENYNEPEAMKNYLLHKGVPESNIIEDFAGRRTYDSCYRTKAIFGQTKIYVVTQDFHITRSVFLCKSLGIDTIGVTSDLQAYSGIFFNQIRDYIGIVEAFWDVKVSKPIPVLGDPISIN